MHTICYKHTYTVLLLPVPSTIKYRNPVQSHASLSFPSALTSPQSQGLGVRLGIPSRPPSAWAALQAAAPPHTTSDEVGTGPIDSLARGVADAAKLVLWVRASLNEHALSGRVRRLCEDRGVVQAHYQR